MSKGVEIVLARMDSHPEEFYGECDKWKFIYKDYFRDAMSEAEKGKIFDRIKEIRIQEFDIKVMETLLPVEEENEERDEWVSSQMAKFGRAPIKREGTTIAYDTSNRPIWKNQK